MTLNACYIVSDETDLFFEWSIRQALPIADRFVFVVDKPSRETWDRIQIAQDAKDVIIIRKPYAHESAKADGMYRNHYLNWLKKHAEGEWALVCDCDEVLSDDAYKLLERVGGDIDCFNVRMRHLWWGLTLEDNTLPLHLVPKRFFRVNANLEYSAVEHPVLQGNQKLADITSVQIWHFNVTKGLLPEIAKYKRTCQKSNIHDEQALKQWHTMHVLGAALLKRFDARELPKIVKDHCCIGEDGGTIVWRS